MAPPPAGTLRLAVDEPEDLLPSRADTPVELWVADALFDALTVWDAHGVPQPAAAVSWESADAITWRFTLRADATWHDGSPVRAADVVRGWTRVVRDGVMAHLLQDVDGYEELREGTAETLRGLEAAGEHTVVVRLREPHAGFPAVAGHPALAPLPPTAQQPDFAGRPVGNGPFAAAEARVPGRFVRLRRFDAWRNGTLPSVDEVLFQTTDPETAFLAFQQRRVHVAEVPPGALRAALDRYGEQVRQQNRPALYLLGMDVTRPPFHRAEVRQALSQAIDRAALALAVHEGNALPAHGLLVPGMPEWVPEACADCVPDPEAARRVFAAAGVRELTFAFNEGGGHELVARRLRQDLAAAGVSLVSWPMPAGDYFRALRAGELGLFRLGWQADVPSADALLRPLLHSASVPRGPDDIDALRHNHGRYRNGEVDRLLDAARATLDPRVSAARYRQAARLAFARDHAFVPLFVERTRLVVSDDVGGLTVTGWAGLRLEAVRLDARG